MSHYPLLFRTQPCTYGGNMNYQRITGTPESLVSLSMCGKETMPFWCVQIEEDHILLTARRHYFFFSLTAVIRIGSTMLIDLNLPCLTVFPASEGRTFRSRPVQISARGLPYRWILSSWHVWLRITAWGCVPRKAATCGCSHAHAHFNAYSGRSGKD